MTGRRNRSTLHAELAVGLTEGKCSSAPAESRTRMGGSVRIVSFARAQKISLSAIECSFVLCEKSEEMSYHGAAPISRHLNGKPAESARATLG